MSPGTLIGIGTIRANGGDTINDGAGGGGRIALAVTRAGADFSAHTGIIRAFGGVKVNGVAAGAGTIYKQRAADPASRGTVLVDNNASGYTDLPPSPPNVQNEVNFAPFVLTNSATLRLTNNFTIGDIFMQSAGARLDLGSNTLTVRSRAHALGIGVVTNYGAIVWWPDIPKGVVFSTW